MKNKLAIYFSVLAMAFVALSCADDNTDAGNPYAYIKSFSIGDIKSSYPAFTDTGKDTLVVKTIAGSSYSFDIDQAQGKIYNNDSLPFKTNLSKVVVDMAVEGVAMIYSEKSGAYEYFTIEDSLDFTAPRQFRITSLDGSYSKYYTISVNAHQVEPELMSWKRVSDKVSLNPEKAVEFNGVMYVFGRVAQTPAVVYAGIGEDTKWSQSINLNNLPSTADFFSLHLFNGALYVVADGDLYKSTDAENWSPVLQGYGLIAIVGASETEGVMWLASTEYIYRTKDGESVEENVCALPADFPLYGVSTSSYALSHNKKIIRNMLVGYATPDMDGNPKVWCKLSNEESWVQYENVGNEYSCPALERLAVVRYDSYLYAFGGKGVVGDKATEAFNSFYISKDNGIVWKASEGFYQQLPSELKGNNIAFATVVDSGNYMWIITSDNNVGVQRGIINRLGFKK